MKDVIWLTVDRQRVVGMTKNLPGLHRGQFPVKLVVIVDEAAFREPLVEMTVHVTDWRQGLDIDTELRELTITQAEAELIRAQRRAALVAQLQAEGYTVVPPPAPPQEG